MYIHISHSIQYTSCEIPCMDIDACAIHVLCGISQDVIYCVFYQCIATGLHYACHSNTIKYVQYIELLYNSQLCSENSQLAICSYMCWLCILWCVNFGESTNIHEHYSPPICSIYYNSSELFDLCVLHHAQAHGSTVAQLFPQQNQLAIYICTLLMYFAFLIVLYSYLFIWQNMNCWYIQLVAMYVQLNCHN